MERKKARKGTRTTGTAKPDPATPLILVTGATGFIGSHTAVALQAAGFRVRLLVRNRSKLQRVMAPHGASFDDVVIGDVTDADTVLQALQGCDGVIHTAAMVSTDRKDEAQVFRTNVEGTQWVIGQATELGLAHIIHVSSVTAIYDPDAEYLTGDEPPAHNDSPYGHSKAVSEDYVRSLQECGFPITITYPAAVIGPLDPGLTEPHEGLAIFLKQVAAVTDTGVQFIDVRDLAAAHVEIIRRNISGERIMIGGHYHTWWSLIQLLEKITGRCLIKMPAPKPLLKVAGFAADWLKRNTSVHLPVSSESMKYATGWVCTDDSKYHELLGLDFHNAEESLRDAIRSLWHAGHLSKAHVGLLAAKTIC
jgi:nucleoside-diphosphate-sugar epimerase